MKENELRLGNWGDCYGLIFQVKSIYEGYVQHKDRGDGQFAIESLKPISLTPEWLERFGFKKQRIGRSDWLYDCLKKEGIEYPNSVGLWYDTDGDLYYTASPPGEYAIESSQVQVRWVHQLQNLVYALTGEELTVKENGKSKETISSKKAGEEIPETQDKAD